MTPSRTWLSTNGLIMPCSSAMRRIHLSDFTVMSESFQIREFAVEFLLDRGLRDRKPGGDVGPAAPVPFTHLEDHVHAETGEGRGRGRSRLVPGLRHAAQ